MENIAELLQSKLPNEPPQLKAMRDYVKDNHGVDVHVGISTTGYFMSVPNAPLASILRMEMPQIQAECGLDKKLFIRISS